MRLESVRQRGQLDAGDNASLVERVTLGKGASLIEVGRFKNAEIAHSIAGIIKQCRSNQHYRQPIPAGPHPFAVGWPVRVTDNVLLGMVQATHQEEHGYAAFSTTIIPAPVIEAGAW